jgi:hypothetical protein
LPTIKFWQLTLICHPVIRRIHDRNAAQTMIDNANSAHATSSAGRAGWAGSIAKNNRGDLERVKASPDVLECHHITGAWNYLLKHASAPAISKNFSPRGSRPEFRAAASQPTTRDNHALPAG